MYRNCNAETGKQALTCHKDHHRGAAYRMRYRQFSCVRWKATPTRGKKLCLGKRRQLSSKNFSTMSGKYSDEAISAPPDLKERTLLLVDRFAHELNVLGAKFENAHPPLPTVRYGD